MLTRIATAAVLAVAATGCGGPPPPVQFVAVAHRVPQHVPAACRLPHPEQPEMRSGKRGDVLNDISAAHSTLQATRALRDECVAGLSKD